MNNEKEISKNNKENIFEEYPYLQELGELIGEIPLKEGVTLPSGRALNNEEIYQLSSRKNIDFIYIMGPIGSGKTTFEAMLYSLFLRKVNDNLIFSGSESLAGFDELLNYIRVNSGDSDVNMPRTPKENREKFYHLELFLCSTNEKRDIVIADVAGELFDMCKANSENLDIHVPYLGIAKNIVIFVDGEAFLKKALWNAAIMNTRALLLTIKSSKQYKRGMNIDIIISKNDEIVKKSDNMKVTKNVGAIKKHLESFEEDFNIKFFRIQALNDYKQKDDSSTSILDMVLYWIGGENYSIKQMDNRKEQLKVTSYFNRFMERQLYE